MSKAAVTARLKLVGELSDLTPERRLDAKLDMSSAGITARLKEVASLLELCRKLEQAGNQKL
ncbi:MAG: hypothetical protein RL701_8014 [Pseudomonadota bacterium]|jgi:hypothetical protein